MILTLIAAASENNVIGVDGDLPWSLPDDMKYFMETTQDHVCIMGRTTYESFYLRPLPNRTNVVVTRNAAYDPEHPDILSRSKKEDPARTSTRVFTSLEDAITAYRDEHDEVFITGGGKIYEQAMPFADRVRLTRVHTTIEGDTFFPDVDMDVFRETSSRRVEEPIPHTFLIYDRIRLAAD